MSYEINYAPEYQNSQKQLAYVNGNSDDFEGDSSESLRALLNQPLFGVVEGNSQEVRLLFNSRFNETIAYHRNLWRDVPSNERDFTYYCNRYSRLFEDLFRLCEKFPNLPIGKEYFRFIALHRHYKNASKAFNARKELRRKSEDEAKIKAYREEREAFYKAHPELRKPSKCPCCGKLGWHIDYFGNNPPFCSICNLGRF